jgi:hypothetical protein
MRRNILLTLLAVVLLTAGGALVLGWAAHAVVAEASGFGGDDPVIDTSGAAEAPSAPPFTPRPLPSATPTTPSYLVHPLKPGETLISDDQIRDYYMAQSPDIVGDLANVELAIGEGQIEVRCMADHGWWYDPRYRGSPPPDSPEGLALNGHADLGAGYRWQDAGCYGLAVHEVGATH